MIYLLDANVLIVANRQYYPIDRVAGFWDWLVDKGNSGDIKIIEDVFDEFAGGSDALAEWATDQTVKDALLLNENVDIDLVRHVISRGYAPDLTDDEIEKVGRDPFLVAFALRDTANRTVVTLEASKPKAIRSNRRIPNICDDLGIRWLDTFGMQLELDFKLN